MAQLEHVFAAGVRFDTEVQYLARSPSGLRYERLPLRRSVSERTCALASVLQCAMVLGQLPRAPWQARVRRAASRALQRHGALDDDAILDSLRAIGSEMANVAGIEAEPLASGEATQIGRAALDALRSGHLSLLRFDSPRCTRWATVIGVESVRGSSQARTLLLLDSAAGEPWACGHNVRIELLGTAGLAVNAKPGFALSCRDLTGQACAVRLSRLIVVKRR